MILPKFTPEQIDAMRINAFEAREALSLYSQIRFVYRRGKSLDAISQLVMEDYNEIIQRQPELLGQLSDITPAYYHLIFSGRAINPLIGNYRNMLQIATASKAELLRCPGIGEATFAEIKDVLESMGIPVGMVWDGRD